MSGTGVSFSPGFTGDDGGEAFGCKENLEREAFDEELHSHPEQGLVPGALLHLKARMAAGPPARPGRAAAGVSVERISSGHPAIRQLLH